MSKIKQLHIDCIQNEECLAGQPKTCYKQLEFYNDDAIIEADWVKKQVQAGLYNSYFSKIPGYKFLEKNGNIVWIAYRKVPPIMSHEYKLTPSEVDRIESKDYTKQSPSHNERHPKSKESKAVKDNFGEAQQISIEGLPF